MTTNACPKGHGPMTLQTKSQSTTFRGVELDVTVREHICVQCGFTASDVAGAGDVQRQMAEAYRQKTGLLTGAEIRRLRLARGLTQAELAGLIGVGVASIKRWEKANIQSESMDKLLRVHVSGDCQGDCQNDTLHGNRSLSLPRVKLVVKQFESVLKRRLLKKTDKFLFVAKYLWYADMVAFRRLGRSMTGAAYAAIPYGPQLNNYRDLIDDIKQSDTAAAEPLSDDEIRIIEQIAAKFPEDRMVYEAAHRERIWRDTPVGQMMPYALASEITEIR